MSDKRYLSSLKRGLRALQFLNYAGRVTAAELARHIKVPRTTAHRILDTLVSEDYVIHDSVSCTYHLAASVRQLAFGFNRDDLMAEAARPLLHRLCRRVLMPVGLTTPVGTDMVIQISMDHEAPLALVRLPEGTAFPVTYGPTGHIFLAHCSPALRGEIIDRAKNFPSAAARRLYPGEVPTDSYLDSVRKKGYAIHLGVGPNMVEGLMAVPVYYQSRYAASLHLRFMKNVLSPEMVIDRFLGELSATAAAISDRLAAMIDEQPELYDRITSLVAVSEHGA